MITHVRIVNFQSLADLSLEVGKLTVLSGPSNSGKSAFVRALRVLVTNPRGDWYRRGDGGEVRSGVAVLESQTEEWHVNFWRAKQVRYTLEPRILQDAGADPPDEEFTAVGSSVPDPVTAVLRIDPELQITDQFDPPFLLTLSPSQVAKRLGTLTKANLMVNATQRANREAASAKKTAEVLSGVIARDRDRLETEFGWYVEAANTLRSAYPARQELEGLLRLHERLSAIRDRVQALSSVSAWQAPAELSQLAELASRADAVVAKVADLKAKRDRVRFLEGDILNEEGHLDDALRRLEGNRYNVEAILSEMDTCPTCGQALTDDALDHIASVKHA